MADITSFYQTYNNSGTGVAYASTNYAKNVINQADVGRELIVKISSSGTINNAELNAAIAYITTGHATPAYATPDTNGPDAFVVAAVGTADGSAFVSGTTADVFLRVQGTGTFSTAGVKAAAEDATGGGAGTFTVTVPAVFAPAL